MPAAAFVPLIVAAVAWVGYCLWDLSQSEVKSLPKWAWALIIAFSVPFGGVAYLLLGRDHV